MVTRSTYQVSQLPICPLLGGTPTSAGACGFTLPEKLHDFTIVNSYNFSFENRSCKKES